MFISVYLSGSRVRQLKLRQMRPNRIQRTANLKLPNPIRRSETAPEYSVECAIYALLLKRLRTITVAALSFFFLFFFVCWREGIDVGFGERNKLIESSWNMICNRTHDVKHTSAKTYNQVFNPRKSKKKSWQHFNEMIKSARTIGVVMMSDIFDHQ